MKNLMKVAIVAIALSIGFAANAQQGQMAAGAGLFIGGSNSTHFGLGAKFQYNVTDPIRLEASFLSLFPENGTLWDFSVNAHYLFPLSGTQLTVYPLVGLGWVGYSVNFGGVRIGTNRFGLNLGGGVDFPLTETITLNFEARYKFIQGTNNNHYFLGLGAAFRF